MYAFLNHQLLQWTAPLLFQGEKDDKIIAVCADDPEYKHFNDIKELAPHRLSEIRRFFEDCILLTHCTILESWGLFQIYFTLLMERGVLFSLTLQQTRKMRTKKLRLMNFYHIRLPPKPFSTQCKWHHIYGKTKHETLHEALDFLGYRGFYSDLPTFLTLGGIWG